jgi:hypothetical protein
MSIRTNQRIGSSARRLVLEAIREITAMLTLGLDQ